MVDLERSARSVFVGNIPYEATEEKLKDIFSEVGPVVSFRLVFDRESGKPKGYGFAEYQDIETAMSAMRNLNNRELLGRTLRVDHATSEKNRIMDDLSHMGPIGPPRESPFGDPVPSKEAPEAISKAVASLPPEQMFELMKQMKQCIQNNPVEARNMLLQNPQLAYALLQAQVVMRIVDPEIAMKMLHRQNPVPTILPVGDSLPERPNGDRPPFLEHRRMMDDPLDMPRRREPSPLDRMDPRGPMLPVRGGMEDRKPFDGPIDRERGRGELPGLGPRDGPVDRGRGPPMGRRSPEPFGRGPGSFGRPDMREDRFLDRGGPMDVIPGMGGRPPMDRGGPPFHDSRGGPPAMLDQIGAAPLPDRGSALERSSDPRRAPRPAGAEPPPAPTTSAGDTANPDQEKAALIMQVLQLTPEQIAMLPEEQRKSILILKEQITGGRQ